MASLEEIKNKFLEMNITVSEIALNKCFDLCNKYNLTAEELCDQWYAFTLTNLGGAAPTVDYLERLERKEYQGSKAKSKIISTPKGKSSVTLIEENPDISGLVSSYKSETPKKQKVQPPTVQKENTPQKPSTSKDIPSNYENSTLNISCSEKYSQRTDARTVQCNFGPTANFKRESDYSISITNMNGGPQPDVRYMYEIMGKKARSLNVMTQNLGQAILTANVLGLSEGPLRINMGEVTTYGRIVSDCDKKINQQSVLLEGTNETNANHTTKLVLNSLSKCSLFPGQVVAIRGNNVNTTTLIAEKIYSEAVLDLPEEPPLISGLVGRGSMLLLNDVSPATRYFQRLQAKRQLEIPWDHGQQARKKHEMQIVIAAGPFTFQDNISYEPLHDLLKYVNEARPHVLILMGPFLDRNHESILNGGLTQTFDSFFEGLIENIMNSVLNADIQIVVVASLKDANHHPVYPTPPYRIREKYPNLTFVPDPCMLNINGLVIGATTADILFHISNFELFFDKNPAGPVDRMGRIASHIINQRNFYPLYPPHKEIYIDHNLFKQYAFMETKPHILVLPSNLRHFLKNIKDCLVVNPERLTKGLIAGTFARIEVQPGGTTSVCERVSCQVLRI